jgi:hypothetical protein
LRPQPHVTVPFLVYGAALLGDEQRLHHVLWHRVYPWAYSSTSRPSWAGQGVVFCPWVGDGDGDDVVIHVYCEEIEEAPACFQWYPVLDEAVTLIPRRHEVRRARKRPRPADMDVADGPEPKRRRHE